MTPEYFDNLKKSHEHFQWSGFICKTCRKVVTKIKTGMKDLENRVLALEIERDGLVAKVEAMEAKVGKCEGGIKVVEGDLVKAKEEVKKEVKNDLREMEERSEKVVVYGLEEGMSEDGNVRKEEDLTKMKDLMKESELEGNGQEMKVFRARKKRDDGKPRPMVVTISDAETREKILSNARRLAKKGDEWKKVFVAPDMTWEQREEAKKQETKLREEAAQKNGEEKDKEKPGKWIVVGQRGRRRIVWVAVEKKKEEVTGGAEEE